LLYVENTTNSVFSAPPSGAPLTRSRPCGKLVDGVQPRRRDIHRGLAFAR
jgi:hypothetical protein